MLAGGQVRATALNFFLGVDDEQASKADNSDDDDLPEKIDERELQAVAGNKDKKSTQVNCHSKRSRKRLLQARRAANKVKRKSKGPAASAVRFAALQLLNDPQGFAEKLLATLRKSTDKFEVKLLMMNLISRIISTHELLVLGFYPFLQKYMQPHQNHVTAILAHAAQAVHPMVPPDAIEPVVRSVANHFVTDGRQDEVIAIGLNTIRELCARQPLAMDETLLKDLVQYKKHRDKGVVMAARGLLSLFRAVDVNMLEKKDRGRGSKDRPGRAEYGQQRVSEGVDGLDLLDLPTDSDSDSDEESDTEDSDGSEEVRGEEGEEDDGEGEEGSEMEVDDEEEGEGRRIRLYTLLMV